MCREPELPEDLRERLKDWYAKGWILPRDPSAPEPSWPDMLRVPEGD